MRRGRLSGAAWVGAACLALVACGESSRTPAEHAHGGEAGEQGGAPGGAGSSGETGGSDDGGDGATSTGGASGRAGAGGDAHAGEGNGGAGNRGGTGANGGSSATGGGAGANGGTSAGSGATGEGGAGGGGDPDVVICDRLSLYEAGVAADRIRMAYERATLTDCRLRWFYYLYIRPVNERPLFATNFKEFTMALWGCTEGEPTSFALVHQPVPLSSTEAQMLIDLYVNLSKIEAGLSRLEVAFVERELDRLAAPLVDRSLDDFPHSQCPGGGEGGAAGAGGAAAGVDSSEGGSLAAQD